MTDVTALREMARVAGRYLDQQQKARLLRSAADKIESLLAENARLLEEAARRPSGVLSRLADELSRIPHADVQPEHRHLAVETRRDEMTEYVMLSVTVQDVREQAGASNPPTLAERFAALPEWAQEWVAGSVVGGVCFVEETRDVWYVAMPFDVCISRIGGGTLSGEVVATKRGDLPYTRIEAAEAMAAHWAKMEAEGDA